MQHLPTFASSIHSLFNPIEIMKLKQIFMLLGAVLLGLTACSKDTPNTPDLSKTLADTEWECVIQGTEQENGEKEVETLLLHFIDNTKFTVLGTHKTLKNGIVVNTEEPSTSEGTYTYINKVATLTIQTVRNGKTETEVLTLTMDASNMKFTGTVTDEDESHTLTFVRKK